MGFTVPMGIIAMRAVAAIPQILSRFIAHGLRVGGLMRDIVDLRAPRYSPPKVMYISRNI